jgi:hypothetical protein
MKRKYALEIIKGNKIIPVNESTNWDAIDLNDMPYNFALQRFNAKQLAEQFQIKRIKRR